MTRKFGAFTLVLTLLINCFAFNTAAQSASLYVNYKIPTDTIDIILTAPDSERANIVITKEQDFDIYSEFALLKELEKSEEGVFEYTASMPLPSGSGKYYVTVMTDKNGDFKDSFWYMSEETELDFLKNKELEELSDSELSVLGIDSAEFNLYKEEISEAYEALKPDGEPDKKGFLTAYAYAYLFGKSLGETDLTAVETLFKSQAASLGFDIASFDELNQDSKNWLLNKLTEGEYKNAEPLALINEWLCLADINGTAQDTVENFKNLLFTKYEILNSADVKNYQSSSQKNSIILKFIQERPFADMGALTDAFKKAVNAYTGSEGQGGTGGTGGGGKASQTQFEYTPGGASASIFADVPVSHWAYERIKTLYSKGIIAGKTADRFYPEDSVTRAEFAKIIALAFFKTNNAEPAIYADVTSGAWYYDYVTKLGGLGIILGDDRGCFNPDAPITRQDAAVIIRRVTEQRGKELPIARSYREFNDNSMISNYAKDAIIVLYEAGLINGMTSDTFAPLNKLTRAQAVQMVSVTME